MLLLLFFFFFYYYFFLSIIIYKLITTANFKLSYSSSNNAFRFGHIYHLLLFYLFRSKVLTFNFESQSVVQSTTNNLLLYHELSLYRIKVTLETGISFSLHHSLKLQFVSLPHLECVTVLGWTFIQIDWECQNIKQKKRERERKRRKLEKKYGLLWSARK